jgi:hypothetical protein
MVINIFFTILPLIIIIKYLIRYNKNIETINDIFWMLFQCLVLASNIYQLIKPLWQINKML